MLVVARNRSVYDLTRTLITLCAYFAWLMKRAWASLSIERAVIMYSRLPTNEDSRAPTQNENRVTENAPLSVVAMKMCSPKMCSSAPVMQC